MHGSIEITFLELFRDTFETHGEDWCFGYYVQRNKMELWEFNFWLAQVSR